MLSKSDLQAIDKIVERRIDDSVENKVKPLLDAQFEQKLKPLLQNELKPIKRDIRRIRKDVDYIIGKFDEGIVHLGRRATRIEKHLHLSPSE